MRRKGVMLVAFDMPVSTKEQRGLSALFRRNLIKNGYIMLQKSIYIKLIRLSSGYINEIKRLDSIAPQEGNIIVFPLTLELLYSIVPIRGTLLNFGQFSDDLVQIESNAQQ